MQTTTPAMNPTAKAKIDRLNVRSLRAAIKRYAQLIPKRSGVARSQDLTWSSVRHADAKAPTVTDAVATSIAEVSEPATGRGVVPRASVG
jgi:hypothetical protein